MSQMWTHTQTDRQTHRLNKMWIRLVDTRLDSQKNREKDGNLHLQCPLLPVTLIGQHFCSSLKWGSLVYLPHWQDSWQLFGTCQHLTKCQQLTFVTWRGKAWQGMILLVWHFLMLTVDVWRESWQGMFLRRRHNWFGIFLYRIPLSLSLENHSARRN